LVWKDIVSSSVRTLYESPAPPTPPPADSLSEDAADELTSYFSLRSDGTLVVQREQGSSWELPPKEVMELSKDCLQDHDCPYLHLHRDGVMVLNWIGEEGTQWHEENYLKVYDIENN
jgi:hypothetical protein